jgi:hypothetical protein
MPRVGLLACSSSRRRRSGDGSGIGVVVQLSMMVSCGAHVAIFLLDTGEVFAAVALRIGTSTTHRGSWLLLLQNDDADNRNVSENNVR